MDRIRVYYVEELHSGLQQSVLAAVKVGKCGECGKMGLSRNGDGPGGLLRGRLMFTDCLRSSLEAVWDS